jgi:putative membrane protein
MLPSHPFVVPNVDGVKLIVRLLINAFALWLAARYVPGIDFAEGEVTSILLAALVFGLVNAFLKPIFKLFSLPLVIFTLGLFALVINTALLAITALILDDLTIDGFIPAFLGALLIAVVSAVLNKLLGDDDD